jgi:hypothetical protein
MLLHTMGNDKNQMEINSIHMKILNDITMQLELILIQIQLSSDFDWFELKSLSWNSIEEKWDANWCKKYWNFAYHMALKKSSSKK